MAGREGGGYQRSVHDFDSCHYTRVQYRTVQMQCGSQLVVTCIILRARHIVLPRLHLLPREVLHPHEVRRGDAILLRRPDLEDGVLVRELLQVEPLDGHAEVALDEPRRTAIERLRVLLLRPVPLIIPVRARVDTERKLWSRELGHRRLSPTTEDLF